MSSPDCIFEVIYELGKGGIVFASLVYRLDRVDDRAVIAISKV